MYDVLLLMISFPQKNKDIKQNTALININEIIMISPKLIHIE